MSQRGLPFGRYPGVSCAEAFSQYKKARNDVKLGIDVYAVKKDKDATKRLQLSQESFTLSVLFYEHYFPRYAKPKKRTWQNDLVYFKTKIEPILGSKPTSEVTPDDIERLIRPMETQGYNTARLTLAVLRKMYNWAILPSSAKVPGEGPLMCVLNPCRLYKLDNTNKPLPTDRYLSDKEIRKLWLTLNDTNADRIIRLLLLTGCRVSEVTGMEDVELDREVKEWTIPASRNKTARTHIVPLTQNMIEIIGPPEPNYVFPAMSNVGHTTASGVYQSLRRHCKSLGIVGIGTHTMRRTFITNMARLEVPLEIRNRLTNHKDQSVDGIYNQHDYLHEKLKALNAWDKKVSHIIHS